MKVKITKVLTILLLLAIICMPTAFCTLTGTVRMKIDNSTAWTNISASESYDECLNLNSTTSTLGTSALEGHLMTDYDWSAMAVLAVSQYGKANTNSPSSSNNNKSGVYDLSSFKRTTGLINTSTSASSIYVSELYDSSGKPKKYVNKIDPTTGLDQNGKTCISFIQAGGTKGWLGGSLFSGNKVKCLVSVKAGLFDIYLGDDVWRRTCYLWAKAW